MQDTETPTTKPQGRGKSSNSILSSDICLLYVVLRMQTCCSGVCRTLHRSFRLVCPRHAPEQQVCILNTTYKRQISEEILFDDLASLRRSPKLRVARSGGVYVRHTPEQQVCILNTTYKKQISEDRISFFPDLALLTTVANGSVGKHLYAPLHGCPCVSVGVRGQNHMSDRSRQSVARCWGVC